MVDQRLEGLSEGLLSLLELIFSDCSLIWSLTLCLASGVTELHLVCSLHSPDISPAPQVTLYHS